ncbi:unnamed protein product, partial [Didymodactylos carnosus]
RKLLLEKYNWKRMATLYQYERQYTKPITEFNNLLQADKKLSSINLEHERINEWENALSKGISFSDLNESEENKTRNSFRDAFDDLQRNNIRIIIGNFNSTMAIRIFCE